MPPKYGDSVRNMIETCLRAGVEPAANRQRGLCYPQWVYQLRQVLNAFDTVSPPPAAAAALGLDACPDYIDIREIAFLHGGVTDCSGLVIACSGGEREGEGGFVEEIDDTLQACACAVGGGRLGVVKRLRRASEDFRILLSSFERNPIALSPLACLTCLIAALKTSLALDSFD
jgi:hypothetical protein